VTDGVLKANDGVGLPNASYLNLDGGILESNTAFTFTRSFSAVPGASKFKMNNGGFSGGGGLLTVQMNGGTANVDWGDVPGDIGSKIVGVLKLSSPTAANRVDIQNQISLQGAERTIYVEDNTGSSADYAIISGKVTNGAGTPASILKLGPGTLELSNPANDYASSGTTTISAGALRADDNAGLPAASFLILDGGVLESRSAYTFTRGLATSGTSKFEWTANGGGFSASGGVFTINVGGTTNPVDWGSTVGTNLCGTLKFGSVTANDQTDFQNGINLNVATAGDLRTIDVTDNTGSTTDVATVSGIIADGTSMPTGGILKTGTGVLNPTGLNTYTGPTQVTAGTLRIDTFNNGGIAGPLGMSSDSATNLVVSSGGTVEYTGPTATTTRGLSVGSGTGSISVATEGVVLTDTGTLAVPSDSTLAKAGAGHLALTTSQTYTGTTQINAGYLRAQDGVGLPTNSPLIFNGGLLESNGAMTFTRTIGTAAGNVQWTNAGGFSAYGGPVTVQLNNGTDTINLTDASSTNSIYQIYFGSTLADNVVDFQNGLNLNGGTRTIYKYDNPATDADYAVISGVMSNSSTSAAANLMVRAPGTLMLTGANTYDSYTGSYTRIYEGVLNAIDGVGLPANSLLRLEGGVFESSGTFIRPISNTTGTNCVYWASTSRGGGFSAYGGPLNVNLGGALATVSFGTTTASQICGPLILSSTTTANDVVTIQNPLDLNGGARTVQVNDNPNKTTDWAVLSGAISNSTGTGSLVKTGDGTLVLTNNLSYNGSTTISAGVLEIQMTNALSTILGAGHLKVTNGVSPTTLTASSVNVGTLTVGSGAKLVIAPPGSGGAGGAAPVPEPSTFVLLALAGLGVLLAAWRRK
jgi:fibronectin-binding autotransporter adhesin